jgi:hemerythrin-like domain-containing protein
MQHATEMDHDLTEGAFIATLADEHALIASVLDAFERWSQGVMLAEADARPELGRFLVFLHRFVDGVHHAKEEDVLFRALAARGDAACNEVIRILLHDHERGRELLGPLEDLAYQPRPWSADDRAALTGAVAAYVGALRDHLAKEEGHLLPLVRARLSDGPGESLWTRLARYDVGQSGDVERYRELADDLIASYCPRFVYFHRSAAPPRERARSTSEIHLDAR